MPTRKKRFTTGRVLATIAVLATVLAPTAVLASHFTDTGASVHKDNIDWLETTGVTSGCTATEYCPTNPVTREQMATFMRRLAGQDPDVPPVVNADKLDGLSSEAFLPVDGTAADSELFDGMDSSQFIRSTHTPWAFVDADNDAATLVRGRGGPLIGDGASWSAEGLYIVRFQGDKSDCGFVASKAEVPGTTSYAPGMVTVGAVNVNTVFNITTTSVNVATFNSAGTQADMAATDGFYLIGMC